MKRPAVLLGLGALLLFAAGLFLVSLNYTILGRGEFLPWDVGPVYKVELFDRFTVYADGEARATPDAVNGIVLAAIAGMAFLTFALLRLADLPGRERTRLFFALLAAGALFLAADEMVGLHETVGYNIPALADVPGIDRPDDLILLAYAAVAVTFIVLFRDVLLSSRRAALLFAGAVGAFVLAALFDVLDVFFDELFEPLATILLLVGFLFLTVETLTAGPEPPQSRHPSGTFPVGSRS